MVAPGGFTKLFLALGLLQGVFEPTPVVGHSPAARYARDTSLTPISQAGGGMPSGARPTSSSFGDPYARNSNAKDDSCTVEPYTSPPLDPQTFPPFDQAKATVYRYRQQQSVNLGSWFVHEQWMTPSLFTCAASDQISEVDIAHGWGSTDGARSVLERHWDTFINESDFQYLASIGINTVRLPIGYWNLGPDFVQGTPYSDVGEVYQYSWPRITRAINTANQYGIGVLVDLHGAVGSQNGQQHSGISDGKQTLLDNPDNIGKTMDVLIFLTKQLANVSNVVGIQILNEPENVDSLPDFYSQAISTMRAADPGAQNLPLYIHDGFDLERFSSFVANRTDFVVEDHHSYFVFTPGDQSEAASDHTKDINGAISDSLNEASNKQHRNLVVDEWSCALTEQSLQNENNPSQAQRDFCTSQMEVYANASAGWSFWAYRKEDCNNDPGWCFTAAVGNALPSTFFSYGTGTPGDPSAFPSPSALANDIHVPTISTLPRTPSPLSYENYHRYETPTKGRQKLRRRHASSPQKRDQARCSLRRSESSGYNPTSTPTSAQPPAPSNTSPTQRAMTKGYSDGSMTAKIFAQYGTSKLGFTGQYIYDSISALGPEVITPGNEGLYSDWFMKGLRDGENIIANKLYNS